MSRKRLLQHLYNVFDDAPAVLSRNRPYGWVYHASLVGLSVLGGLAVFAVSHELFPYLSVNHDEGVYLQQAAMLLEGKLWLTSEIPRAFRPWFFIRDGSRLYPKYTPVAALMFAPGVWVGHARMMLALIAAGNTALIGALATEAFDRQTGILAAGIALATPFFLFISATFVAYAPTTLLNLLFALCYVRAFRRPHGRRYAVLAGIAIGLAFFSRPYTAVLFAVPFLVHAVVAVGRELLTRSVWSPTIEREVIIGVFGFWGVGCTLVYNHVVTGDAFLFPYQAFAPLDGLGFGPRKLLGYEREYTIEVAWRTNKQLLAELFTRWTVAAPIGSILAAVGLFPVVGRYRERRGSPVSDRTLRLLLLGVCLSVSVGNIYFWGTLNTLGATGDPTDGFMGLFGPFYHFDLVLPLSVFGSAGVLWLGRTLRSVLSQRWSRRRVCAVLLAATVVSAPVIANTSHTQLQTAAEEHTNETEQLQSVYAPFEHRALQNALVFMPPTFGPWLSHPFQALRNGGSLESGAVVYALQSGPGLTFATLDGFPNRTPYRLTYHGRWPGVVTPKLRALTVINASTHRLTTAVKPVGKPFSVRLSASGDRIVRYRYPEQTGWTANGSFDVEWMVSDTQLGLVAIDDTPVVANTTQKPPQPLSGPAPPSTPESTDTTIDINGSTTATLTITFMREDGTILTYRYRIDIDADAKRGSTRLLWPGSQKVCNNTQYCGRTGTYLTDKAIEYPNNATMNTTRHGSSNG